MAGIKESQRASSARCRTAARSSASCCAARAASKPRIITYGAVIQALSRRTRGRCDDIVLGHDDFAGYLAERKFFGATVGRYANRIANGRFSLEAKTFQLPSTTARIRCMAAIDGFDRKLWSIAAIDRRASPR